MPEQKESGKKERDLSEIFKKGGGAPAGQRYIGSF